MEPLRQKRKVSIRLDGQSKGLLIASIKGMTTRNQAEVLKGTEFIKRKLLPNTDDGEYYHADS